MFMNSFGLNRGMISSNIIAANSTPSYWNSKNMVLLFTIPLGGSNITLPIGSTGTDILVNWGDGTTNSYTTTQYVPHTYTLGTYICQISGALTTFSGGFNGWAATGANKISRVFSYGSSLGLTNLYGGFAGCSILIDIPSQLPTTVTGVNGRTLFRGAALLNSAKLINYDVSNLTNLSLMFYGCSAFNQDISGWDVSNNTSLYLMFYGCSAFNQDISGWDTNGTTDMSYAFCFAKNFNQNLNSWDVSKVTTLKMMFYGASDGNKNLFNQYLGSWKLRPAGVDMTGMLTNTSMSQLNYDRTLISWANYVLSLYDGKTAITPASIAFGGPNITPSSTLYTLPDVLYYGNAKPITRGSDARDYLVDIALWTITDGTV